MTREELDRLDSLLAQATPGPWLVRAERHRFIHVYAGGGGIAHMDQTDGEAAVNARLTVELHNAAPALLAAAREAEEWKAKALRWDAQRQIVAGHIDAVFATIEQAQKSRGTNDLFDEVAMERAEVARLRAELETERMRLAACGVAAGQNTPTTVADRIGRDNPYYSGSYAGVCAAVDREMALRAELDAIGAVVGWSRERCEQDGDSPLDCAIMMRADLDRARTERDICAERYDSLLFAVGTKRPGESRHETALRYIQQAEQRTREPGQASALAQEPPA